MSKNPGRQATTNWRYIDLSVPKSETSDVETVFPSKIAVNFLTSPNEADLEIVTRKPDISMNIFDTQKHLPVRTRQLLD